jgi:hypothetical protein
VVELPGSVSGRHLTTRTDDLFSAQRSECLQEAW